MEKLITSIHNPIIEQIKSLQQKKRRNQLEQFFIEGYRIVKDALLSGIQFQYVVVSNDPSNDISELIMNIASKDIEIYRVSDKLFKQISDTDNPQGILAVINKKEYDFEKIYKLKREFVVLLENIQDPGNMGTLIRTADAAGVSRIVVSKGCVDIYNPKVVRSTMGSIFHLPIIEVDDLGSYIDNLKDNGYQLYAAHLKGNTNYFEVNMTGKSGVIIGNEANGISEETAKKCNLIKIPMLGEAESLNASMAGGIIIYEYVRQKMNK